MEVSGSGEDVTQDEGWGQAPLAVLWKVEVARRRGKVMVVMTVTKPSFTEALRVFETVRVFIYVCDIAERDQVNIVNI
jgi:hypothetical protein